MFKSLNRLKALPKKTKVYSAHEYTVANLMWALSQSPKNPLIISRLKKEKKKREINLLTLPSTIDEETKTNLFFQAKNIKEFSILRKNKDNWKA